jgi:acyl carrier protein
MFFGENMMLDSDQVRAIIKDAVKGVDITELGDEQDFSEVGIDSLDHSMILLAVEEKSNIKIPDEAVDRCASVAGIVAFLKDNQA